MRIARTFMWMGAVLLVLAAAPAGAQRGYGRGAMRDDPARLADMQVFHALLDHRAEITRQVTYRSDGVETLTESDNQSVAQLLQTHVDAMLARVKEGRPIHARDPLFREIFQYGDRITTQVERTPRGVRTIETSDDPYVVRLLRAHADVVSAFIANGRAEMMKDHPLP